MHESRIPVFRSDDWGDLFHDLAQHTQKGRVLIVLDEITWMGSKDPSFLGKLKTAWDLHFKQNPKLILILSESNSYWIEQNILSSTGFLGRVSYRLLMEELPLHECAEFWGVAKDTIASYEKFKVLAITGGVPRYLEEVQAQLSAEENIKRLCYRKEGLLFNEFGKQLLPKERSFMVIGGLNLPMPHACGLQRTLQHQRMLQAYRDLDSHCSLHAVGFHT